MKAKSSARIIGGKLGLEGFILSPDSKPPFLQGGDILMVNARSGISLLIDLFSPGQVWMPSYLCNAMIKATDESKAAVRFYEVEYDLRIKHIDWTRDVQAGDFVVFVDYFGFPFDPNYALLAKQRGAWILEDACQALLSNSESEFSDFIIYSPRKFIGVPDGGIVRFSTKNEINEIRLGRPPEEWWLRAFFGMILRREYDLHGGNHGWSDLFQEAATHTPIGRFAISELTHALICHGFDYPFISERRIENYSFLASQLCEFALFPFLGKSTVPLGFPIRINDRDRIRKMLLEKGILSTVHWPINGFVPEVFQESHRLSNEIMTLPCDQRYDLGDMQYIVHQLSKLLNI